MELIDDLLRLLPISSAFQVLRVEKCESAFEVHIYLSVDAGATPEGYRLHSHYHRRWEHLKLFQYRTFLHCDLPVYQHRKAGTFLRHPVDFSRNYSRFTRCFEQEVMRLMSIHFCLSSVARNLGIRVQRVEQIYHHYTADLAFSCEQSVVCTRVGVDETSTKKGHHYITTFVDMDTHQIIDIQEGKSATAIQRFFEQHPYPEAVKDFSIDMSPAFISGIQTYFSSANITFDKWHFIKLLYKHLDTLDKKATEFRQLTALLMENIHQFYEQTSLKEAQAQLSFIADFAQEKMGTNPISNTINRHFEGIMQHFVSKLNNGLLEGLNSKIQVLKRIARGFRYTENFCKMIRFAINTKNTLQVIS